MSLPSLPKIFDYFDCIKFLRDYYEARHVSERWFSYRYIQKKTGIDPGYLFKVFQGKKPLPFKKVGALAKALGLGKRETEYFNLLVFYSKAKSNDEIRTYFEKMLSYGEVAGRKVEVKEYAYYSNWYNAAIRNILSYYPFRGDYAALAKMTVPVITAAEAKKAVGLLYSLGFAKKSPDGTYKVTDRFLTSGEEWHAIAVRRFQQDTIQLAHQALDNVPKELRDISTVTLTLSQSGFEEARERIKQLRHDLLDLASRQEKPSGAYHVNIQVFPIGRQCEGAEQ
jgi:uncharacterized protein (TIGR02147 family)